MNVNAFKMQQIFADLNDNGSKVGGCDHTVVIVFTNYLYIIHVNACSNQSSKKEIASLRNKVKGDTKLLIDTLSSILHAHFVATKNNISCT